MGGLVAPSSGRPGFGYTHEYDGYIKYCTCGRVVLVLVVVALYPVLLNSYVISFLNEIGAELASLFPSPPSSLHKATRK